MLQSTTSPASSAIRPAHAEAVRALPEIYAAFTQAQMRACADWLALTQEHYLRCALTRTPLEYLSTASLMLPECVSSVMRYYRDIAEVADACRRCSGASAGH